jgi:hypothetical protein
MRRLLLRFGLWLRSPLRLDPSALRKMSAILLLIAAGLTVWVFELGAVLQGQARVRNWSSTWVGLDLMEITGLVLTAVALRRRSAYLSAVAAVTATLFALDAWFDVLTASAGPDWYESLAAAFSGEIPMTVPAGWSSETTTASADPPGCSVTTGRGLASCKAPNTVECACLRVVADPAAVCATTVGQPVIWHAFVPSLVKRVADLGRDAERVRWVATI